jgi:ADP-ribose pyrophosphatase YjhB (NUDIX family)
VAGRPHHTGLRSALAGHARWTTVITQGDPTEPNIAEPLCWLDFEHAGRNALASDVANFLWYLLAMGGWLVAAYQPSTYERTRSEPARLVRHHGSRDSRNRQSRGCEQASLSATVTRKQSRSAMTDRVRGLLITPDGDLLTIQRIRPGHDPYWVLPGGGVEDGEELETALARELREEAAATAEIHSLLHVLDHGTERQYIYLTRAQTWSASPGDRTGPEFTGPARGDYRLQPIPLTTSALTAIDLKPEPLARFLTGHLRTGTDLFTLPDLRGGHPGFGLARPRAGHPER